MTAIWLLCLLACTPDPARPDSASGAITLEGAVSIDADYTIPAGETVTITPGAVLTFAQDAHFIVDGELIAVGTENEPITFTGDSAAPWAGIVFHDTTADAVFTGVDVYESGSLLDNVVVEHAVRGADVDGASPYLHAVTFRANHISPTVETIGGAGLLVRNGSTTRIRDCAFEDNVAEVFAFGGGLYVDHADPIVQDSVFTGNSATYGGAISNDLMASPIVGSTFTGNRSDSEGGAVSLVSSVSAVLNNVVTGNTAETDGAGIHVCVDCYPHAAPYLLDDVVTDNVSDGGAADGAAGVGTAFLGGIDNVALHGNVGAEGPSDFAWFNLSSEAWPDWVASPSLSAVWWGTTDPEAIAATVFDGADDDTYSSLGLEPVRATDVTPPVPRVVISSRKMLYEDAGDEVPVFLTLYNPGVAVTVNLSLWRDGALYQGEIGYPGADGATGSWTLDLPENSVWFGTVLTDVYDGVTIGETTWQASITAGTGALIGVTGVARYMYQPAP